MTEIRPTIDDGQSSSPGADAPGEPRPSEHAQAHGATGTGPTAGPDSAPQGVPVTDGDGELAELEGDLDELVRTAAQRDEYLALAQRTQADFENYRKRVARESTAAHGRGVASLAKELLPALDNLDRALDEAGSAAEGAGQEDPLLQGVRLVRSELLDGLARAGVESFSPLGEDFDPSLHEAMATTDQPHDGAASGTVVEVYQPGYRLGANIIRPARVLVAA